MSESAKKLSSDSKIAIAAIVIALASLLLTVWEGLETRQHDRLSVSPRLIFTAAFANPDADVGILVSNKGFGPAIIRDEKIFIDDKAVESDDYGGWKHTVSQLGLDKASMQFHSFDNGDAVGAGETVPLFVIGVKDQTTETRQLLEKAVSRLKVVITYESIYGVRNSVIFSAKNW